MSRRALPPSPWKGVGPRFGLHAAFALTTLALPAAAETVAIVHARIETAGPAGAIPNGTLVIANGRIAGVGPNVPVPTGARVIDAAGQVVTPGLIAASSNLGVAEVEGVRETRDDGAGQHLGAGFDIAYGVDPASTLIPIARLTGVTRAAVTPAEGGRGGGYDEEFTAAGNEPNDRDPGLFSGQAALITLDAGQTQPVFRAKTAVALAYGEAASRAAGSRGSAMVLIRSALDEVRRYAKARGAYGRDDSHARYTRDDLEALVPVVEGRTPLLVRVHKAADIREILKLAADYRLKLILEGVEEGWMVAPELARAGVPVIVDTEDDLPASFETLGARLDNAAKLNAAGVTVAIEGSRDFDNLRQARFNAGTAVANGLPYPAAIAALTINPARIWGFADRAGTLEVGRDADVVLWSGDPLETQTAPTAVFIKGVQQPMRSRVLDLTERYLPNAKAGAR